MSGSQNKNLNAFKIKEGESTLNHGSTDNKQDKKETETESKMEEKLSEVSQQLTTVNKQYEEVLDFLKDLHSRVEYLHEKQQELSEETLNKDVYYQNLQSLENQLKIIKEDQLNHKANTLQNYEYFKDELRKCQNTLMSLDKKQNQHKQEFLAQIKSCNSRADDLQFQLTATINEIEDLKQNIIGNNETFTSYLRQLNQQLSNLNREFTTFVKETEVRNDDLSQWKSSHTKTLYQLKETLTLCNNTNKKQAQDMEEIGTTLKQIMDVHAGIKTTLKHQEGLLEHHKFVIKYVKEDESDIFRRLNSLQNELKGLKIGSLEK
ncbi:paramyosin [Aethina tumida]|uniref:paramyosin n=1 Tax=Aethina tumida TaxID=116153 RepID=UPI002148C9E6|nr:paramyosin [Aethina tumida]